MLVVRWVAAVSYTHLDVYKRQVLDVSGQTQSESSFAPISEIVLSNLHKLNILQQHNGAITGVPTGFKDVDHVFNGLQKRCV